MCEQFGYSRKHAIKLLNAKAGWGGHPSVAKGRPALYGPAEVEVLLNIWRVAEQPCGKRLVQLLPLWLPYYGHIPIRTDNWEVSRPGLQAVWNKAAAGIVEATRGVEKALPFELLGFDCDNGSEFLNWHLVRHFQERPRQVGFTRSRPYHKDDNGHVEQKNWTHVRQLLGYDRLEDPGLCAPINHLYAELWEPLHNYFCPSAKLLSKERHGAKMQRRHDVPTTPCDRLLACPDVDQATKEKLQKERTKLNPFDLARKVETALRRIFQHPLRSSRPTGSLHSGDAEGKKTATTSVS